MRTKERVKKGSELWILTLWRAKRIVAELYQEASVILVCLSGSASIDLLRQRHGEQDGEKSRAKGEDGIILRRFETLCVP